MSPRFVLGRENVPCVAEVVNSRSKLTVQTLTYQTIFINNNIFSRLSVSEGKIASLRE